MNKESKEKALRNDEAFEQKLLGLAADEQIIITITIENPTLLQRILKKEFREYVVRRHTNLEQNIRIAKILSRIPVFDLENKDNETIKKNIELVAEHTEDILEVICILLKTNDKKFLLKNLSNQDMFAIVVDMLAMIDLQAFTSTIVLTRNKTSLKKSE